MAHQYAHRNEPVFQPARSAGQRAAPRVAQPPSAKAAPPPAPPPLAAPPTPPRAEPQPVLQPAPAPAAADQPSRRRAKLEIAALRPPKKAAPPSASTGRPTRPSLSAQLAAIRDQGAAILEELQTTFNVGPAVGCDGSREMLCTLRPRSVRVGSSTCNWPGVLRLFADRAEYAFSHPRHRRVQMVMRYRDMSQLGLSRSSGTLAFRIEHNLEYFAHEYNHYDETHRLVLTLGTAADVDALTTSGAWARMQALCLSRS